MAIYNEFGLRQRHRVLATGNCLLRKEQQDSSLRQDYKQAFELDQISLSPFFTGRGLE